MHPNSSASMALRIIVVETQHAAFLRQLRDLAFPLVTFVFALSLVGCGKKPEAHHYALHGRIISVDKLGHELIIDHDAIPGFMEAMTMPYPVADNAMLEQVGPGDEIRADLKVEDEHIAIDKLEVVKKAAPGSAPVPKPMHVPTTGEQAPGAPLIAVFDEWFIQKVSPIIRRVPRDLI